MIEKHNLRERWIEVKIQQKSVLYIYFLNVEFCVPVCIFVQNELQ